MSRTLGDSVGSNTGQSGSLVLTGAGTTWTEVGGAPINGQTLGGVSFGYFGPGNGQSGSAGYLTISNGASLITGGFAQLGGLTGSFGSASITSGGVWTAASGLTIGNAGVGTLTVSSGTVTTASGFNIGQSPGGNGLVSLSSGSVLDANSLNIGGTAAVGTLILANSTLANSGFANFGSVPDGVGLATVSPGALLTANGMSIGNFGSGLLTINGGTVTSFGTLSGTVVSGGGIDIGQNFGSDGSVSVTGGGRLSGTSLNVGTSGTGTLSINGGVVSDSGSFAEGSAAGSFGSVTVANGTLSFGNGMNLGLSGDGILTINSGGTVLSTSSTSSDWVGNLAGSNGELDIEAGGTFAVTMAPQASITAIGIGLNAASVTLPAASGSAIVSGAGALLTTNDNPMSVGNAGLGSLLVTAGGSVAVGTSDTSLDYGLGIANSGGTGNVTVNGTGSTLTVDGYLLDGRGGTGSMLIENNGKVVVNDAAANGSGIGIGAGRGAGPSGPANSGGNGVALVTSGGLLDLNSTTSSMNIGGNGVNGALTVNNGGMVMAGTAIAIGTATSASGTVYGGTGELDIGAGGTVFVNNPVASNGYDVYVGTASSSIGTSTTGTSSGAASGQVVVSGAGAVLNANSLGIAVGWLSNGSLMISQGGTVLSGSQNEVAGNALSIGRRSTGSVTITDPGSNLTATGVVYVARGGTGSLTIENGGSLSSLLDPNGVAGISVGGTGLGIGISSGVTYLITGGSGFASVNTGGDMYSAQSIKVGTDGTEGTLNIGQGGTAEAGSQVVIGTSVTVAAGDTIILPSSSIISNGTLISSTGIINVSAGGLLQIDGSSSTTPGLVIGSDTSSTGELNVVGAGATVNERGELIVGQSGFGALVIQGGTVSTMPVVVAGITGASVTAPLADVSAAAGSDGSNVTVTGPGAEWQILGDLNVGDAAAGSLAITAGGSVVAASLDTAVQNTGSQEATSQITVSGPGSQLNVINDATVGDAGSALMSILNGATVFATDLTIGAQSTGRGAVFLSDAGSQLDLAGTLFVGTTLGVGELTIGPSATATATTAVLNGQVVDEGGTLNAPQINITTGEALVGFGAFGTAGGLVLNSGTIDASGGTLIEDGTVGGTGSLLVTNGATLDVTGAVANTQSVVFATNSGALDLEDIGGFAGTITVFAAGDTIFVNTASLASFTQSGSIVEVISSGTTLGVMAFASTSLASTAETAGGALVDVTCFAAGTRLSTERGEIAVEGLVVGDRVQLARGPSKPMVWIGHRTVDCARHPAPRKVWPVRVSAGAFGPCRPQRDLWLSPDHALFVNDVLIPVKHLINGTTIAQVAVEEITYYHVELPQHAVILAEGLPAESYLDTGDRKNFANGGGPIKLYPDFSTRTWEAEGCAPLVVTGPQLEAARQWVNGLAGRVILAA